MSCLAVPAAGASTALVLSAPQDRFESNFTDYLGVVRRLVDRLSAPRPD